MKKTKYLLASLLASAMLLCSCTPALSQFGGSWTNWLDLVTEPSSNWVAAVYPSYAPDLKNDKGENKQWGGGMALLYKINDYAYTGMRLDSLAEEFWMPSITATLQSKVRVAGLFNATLFGTGGVAVPAGKDSQDSGKEAIVIGGIGAIGKIKEWKGGSLNIGYSIEKWSGFDGYVHHPLLVFQWSF